LEQKVNASDKLSEADKFDLQQYINALLRTVHHVQHPVQKQGRPVSNPRSGQAEQVRNRNQQISCNGCEATAGLSNSQSEISPPCVASRTGIQGGTRPPGALRTQVRLCRLIISAFGDCLSHRAWRSRSTLEGDITEWSEWDERHRRQSDEG